MSRELDSRDFSTNQTTAARSAGLVAAASAVSDSLPGAHRIRITKFDATTGNPSGLVSENSPPEQGNFIARALQHLQGVGPALGLTAAQPIEFVPDPQTQTTSSGAAVVHLQQNYKSIPIFQAAQTVNFTPAGAIDQAVGTTVTVPNELGVAPSLRAEDAVLKAAQFLAAPQPDDQTEKDSFGQSLTFSGLNVAGWQPKVIAAFANQGNMPRVLDAGPFGEAIKAALMWFPLAQDLRLGWHFVLSMPNNQGQYRVIVDAQTGDVLYSHQLVQSIGATGLVYTVDGSGARVVVPFPRPLSDYTLPAVNLPAGFPMDWVVDSTTVGSVTNAHREDSGPPTTGTVNGNAVAFTPADSAGDDQKVLNIFYYSSFMHDYFYMLGFREADGNFQQSNGANGGVGNDPVDARAYAGEVWATASMSTPVDGSSPVMQMGLVTSTNRHTSFDSTVVFHEFTHGVTHRLVGGPTNDHSLDAPQSAGMGEGWSDYAACTVTGANVIAAWVLATPGGARAFPYDGNFPDTFANLGSGRYTEMHNIGEIWCATLLEMNRAIGTNLGIQLVVDSLKLMPANPGFLDARDAILQAVDHMLAAGTMTAAQHDSTAQAIRTVFGRFGMGPNAQSNGASLSGIVGDVQTGAPAAASQPTSASTPQPVTGASVFARVGAAGDGFQTSAGVAAVASANRVDLFAVSAAGQVMTAAQNGSGGWSEWNAAGTSPVGPIAAVAAVSATVGRLDRFVVDGSGKIQTSWASEDGAWAPWSQVGAASDRAPVLSPLSAVSAAANEVDLFLIASDGGIYTAGRVSSASAWSDWARVGSATDQAPVLTPLTAVSVGAGLIDLFLVAADGAVYTTARTNSAGAWADWEAAGSGAAQFAKGTRVTAASATAGELELFAIGVDGGVYTASRAEVGASWSGWTRVGSASDQAPAQTVGASAEPERIDLYVVGGDGAVYTSSRAGAGGAWSDWALVGAPAAGALAVAASASAVAGKGNVYALAGDAGIYAADR